MIDLSSLNKQQLKAVEWGNTPLMVIASAGSGKTRVLTYRVAHLIKRGTLPSRLMVTTFTKDAADEMRERLEGLIGVNKADRLKIGTFHSLCYRIYRDLLEHNGRYATPKLIMGGGQWMTIVKIINSFNHDANGYIGNRFDTKDIKSILGKISWWKNEGKMVKDVEKELKENNIPLYNGDPNNKTSAWSFTRIGTYFKAYQMYQKELTKNSRIDFDDMLCKTYAELKKKKNKSFLERKRKRIEHILIDEAQDLNRIQFLLTSILAGNNKRITMVGDDYQAIYGFRGVDVARLINFGKKYDAEIIRLEQNYRSTKHIVSYGNTLIKYNTVQIWKNLFTKNSKGKKAILSFPVDVEHEADIVLEKIQDLIIDGFSLNEIAVMFRTNAQSRAIVDRFILNDIPHRVYSKEGFYDRKEIKDMLAYLRVCYAPFDAEPSDFGRIVNRPTRFIAKKFIDTVEEYLVDYDIDTFWQALHNYGNMNLTNQQANGAERFINDLTYCYEKIKNENLTTKQAFEIIIEKTSYLKWLNRETEQETEEPDNDKKMNLDSLLKGAERFNDIEKYLLFIDSIDYDEHEEDDAIHVLTIHKCVSPETYVETEHSMQQIKDIKSFGRIQSVDGISSYKGKFKRRKSKMCKITTKRGYSLEMTLDHKITVWDGNKHVAREAIDLKTKDLTRIKIGSNFNYGIVKVSKDIERKTNQEKIWPLPKYINSYFAEFLGLMVADGTVYYSGFRYGKGRFGTVQRFAKLCKLLFDFDANIKHIKGKKTGMWYVEMNSTYVSRFLLQFKGLQPNNKFIPDEILKSSNAIQCSFIKGIFEDGSVVAKNGKVDHIRFDNKNPELVHLVQLILLRNGIISTKKDYNYNGSISALYVSGGAVKQFVKSVGLCSPENYEMVKDLKYCEFKNVTIPISRDECIEIGKDNFDTIYDYRNARYRGYISRYKFEKIKNNPLSNRFNFHYEEIESIEFYNGESFCVEVPKNNRFIQNGFDGWNSKGREFPCVHLIGCCEGVMPHHKADDMEEERRICYVAITRAMEELYIYSIVGKFNRMNADVSRFVREMGVELPTWIKSKQLEVPLPSQNETCIKYDAKGNVIKINQIIDGEVIDKVVEKENGRG